MKDSVFIIAEAGVNHNGSMSLAKKLVDSAKEAGANAVKFQTFKTENLVTTTAEKANYQKETTDGQESQFDMIKKLELSYDNFKELKEYCIEKEIMFLSTAFDLDSIDFLNELGISVFKVPSGELTNFPYLRKISTLKQSLILSTGMATIEEIRESLKVLTSNGKNNSDITVLQCNTEYPTPMSDVNLRAMHHIESEFKVKVGYSDHTQGISVPIAAVALGAKVIEKHFTLDKEMEGPDHKASLNPLELKDMVKAIRDIEAALGDGNKKPSPSEIKNTDIARKSIVASRNIEAGDIFTEENLTTKRPGTGISPMKWETIIGNVSTRSYQKDDIIQ
jgi:N,N'-diacetyllegionaminate synthase